MDSKLPPARLKPEVLTGETGIEIPKYEYVGFGFGSSARCGKKQWGIGLGDPVVAPRRVILLPVDAEQRQRLLEISRSRDRAHEPRRTGVDHSGLFARPVGLFRGTRAGVTQQTDNAASRRRSRRRRI
jgi:hypothetical protein